MYNKEDVDDGDDVDIPKMRPTELVNIYQLNSTFQDLDKSIHILTHGASDSEIDASELTALYKF